MYRVDKQDHIAACQGAFVPGIYLLPSLIDHCRNAATSLKGRLIYGAGIGALLYIIRTWGGYPDAIAFAVLFMNLSAPMIDHLVQPRTFGHDIQPVKWRKEQK